MNSILLRTGDILSGRTQKIYLVLCDPFYCPDDRAHRVFIMNNSNGAIKPTLAEKALWWNWNVESI